MKFFYSNWIIYPPLIFLWIFPFLRDCQSFPSNMENPPARDIHQSNGESTCSPSWLDAGSLPALLKSPPISFPYSFTEDDSDYEKDSGDNDEDFSEELWSLFNKLPRSAPWEDRVITRHSKHCGFSIYIFDNSKSIMKKVKINGQVGQGEEDGLVWSGLC